MTPPIKQECGRCDSCTHHDTSQSCQNPRCKCHTQECCAACNGHFGPAGGYNEACWTCPCHKKQECCHECIQTSGWLYSNKCDNPECPCHMGQESKHDYDVGFETGKREGLKAAIELVPHDIHPEFCAKSGKQYRKCLECTLETLRAAIEAALLDTTPHHDEI